MPTVYRPQTGARAPRLRLRQGRASGGEGSPEGEGARLPEAYGFTLNMQSYHCNLHPRYIRGCRASCVRDDRGGRQTLDHFPLLHYHFIFFLPHCTPLQLNRSIQDRQAGSRGLPPHEGPDLGTPSVLAVVFPPCVHQRIDRFRSHQRTMAPT